MRRSVAQSATHCAALHLGASSPSCSLAITCERERKNRHNALRTVFAQKRNRESAVSTSSFILTRHISPISCTLRGPFSPVLSLRILASVVAKRHTFPKEQTTRPTDRARTHAHTHSLSNSLSFSFVRSRSAPRNKKTRHLFGFLMVFLRSRTTINYDLFLINSNSLPVKYNHYNYVCVFCFFFATVFLNFCLFCFVFAENYACQA